MDDPTPKRVKYGSATPLVRSANGIEGTLCYGHCRQYFLRVRDATVVEGFIDYDLRHSDLSIRIIDEDAAFYDFGSGNNALLDHAPDTLGLKMVETP